MTATSPDRPAADQPPEAQPAPQPDQDGPHDVPDDEVIEKTLPSGARRETRER